MTHGQGDHVLITGGAGFIGSNLARRLLAQGSTVLLFDNLSRAGAERNARWLRDAYDGRVHVQAADIRDRPALDRAVERADCVFHLAAQVAVTSSLADPVHDFDVNARGTLNVIEAVRARHDPPPLIFTSTNKVYGALRDVELVRRGTRYEPIDGAVRATGIAEGRGLDFHSPYGCSKGTADQYVIDCARCFGLRTVVFRMSCIYGPRQFGTEDQGWVAHFLARAIEGRPITLYGDGLQVRDVLFVDDLVDALLLAWEHVDGVAGQAFNIGGGPDNTLSLLELLSLIEELRGDKVAVRFRPPRSGDQRYYVADTRKFQGMTGWAPRVSVRDGVERLHQWLLDFRSAADTAPLDAVAAAAPVAAAGAYHPTVRPL